MGDGIYPAVSLQSTGDQFKLKNFYAETNQIWDLVEKKKEEKLIVSNLYSKTCLKRLLKKNTKIGFQYRLSLNAGQKYCRMLQGEHSAILLTFIKLPFSIKTLVLSIFLSGRLRQVLL